MRDYKKWLFISPHADDAEFGCGGLMAQLARRSGVEVQIAIMTSREQTTGETVELTRQYQQAALDALGLHKATITFARLLSRRLPDMHEEVRQALARIDRDFGPDVVFTTPMVDRMQDHSAVSHETARVFRGRTVFEYEVVSSSLGFAPTGYLEIGADDLERKIAALHCHAGQSHKSYFAPDVIQSLARLRGAQSGAFQLAEAFRAQTTIWRALPPVEPSKELAYDERASHLTSRLSSYQGGGGIDIAAFVLEHASPQPGESVLDVCCGTGKQSLAFAPKVGTTGRVLGLDLQEELLDVARRQVEGKYPQAVFRQHDCNERFPVEPDSVDLLSCCYGIYYMEDLRAVVSEIRRVLKPGGRVFVMGPAGDNNQALRKLHTEISQRPEPEAVTRYRGRIENELRPLLEENLQDVRAVYLRSDLRFESVEAFKRYYEATPLLAKTFDTEEERQVQVAKMSEAVASHIKAHGAFTVGKNAIALIARRSTREGDM